MKTVGIISCEKGRKSNLPLILSVLFLLVVDLASAQSIGKVLEFQNAVFGPARGVQFRSPAGVAFDRQSQEVYVADSGNSSISVYDLNGRFLFSFPCRAKDPRTGKDAATQPKSIAVGKDGTIYFTEGLSRSIQVRNYRGETISTIDIVGKLGYPKKRATPEYLFMTEDDLLYVTIGGDEREIVVLDRDWEIVKRFRGSYEGFTAVTGIWVDNEGKIYVTDAITAPCVQVYDRDGELLFGFGTKDIGDENFSQPRGVVTTANGDIWVVDAVRQVVKRFDREGEFIEMIGGLGVGVGDMRYPVGITGDGVDKLFVVERVGARYQYFQVKENPEL